MSRSSVMSSYRGRKPIRSQRRQLMAAVLVQHWRSAAAVFLLTRFAAEPDPLTITPDSDGKKTTKACVFFSPDDVAVDDVTNFHDPRNHSRRPALES